MNDRPDARQATREGLCASCTHAARITSARGSTFTLCELSRTDPRFPRYPRLPVLACDGYRAKVG
jgi:hypothetical protein